MLEASYSVSCLGRSPYICRNLDGNVDDNRMYIVTDAF